MRAAVSAVAGAPTLARIASLSMAIAALISVLSMLTCVLLFDAFLICVASDLIRAATSSCLTMVAASS